MSAAPSRRERLRRRIVAAGAVLIFAFAASSVIDTWRSYRQSLAAIDRELGNLAKALAEEAARSFQTVDLLLRDTASWYQANAGKVTPEQAKETLANRETGSPVHALYVTDAQRSLRYSSRPLPAHAVSAANSTLIVVDERVVLVMSRDLETDGRFAGTVSALADLADFQEFYDAIDLGPGNTIVLLRDDSTLLVRRPPAPTAVGKTFPELARARDAQAARKREATLVVSPFDGTPRFVAVASVRNFPFVVMTSRDEAVALAPWSEQTVHIAVRTVVLSLLGALVVAALVRQLARADAGEQAVREQAALLDLTRDTILVRDMNDRITYWNRGAEELYGWTAAEAVGQTTHRLLQTSFPEPLERITEKLVDAGRWEGELVHTRRDGTRVAVASRWALQRDEDGNAAAVLETNNDITKRKRTEEALRRSEEQWKAVFAHNPTMYFMVDAAGGIVSVNAFGAEQLGYTIEELIGRPVQQVFAEPSRDAARAHLAACLEHLGRTMTWELRKQRKDGTLLWVRETAKAVLIDRRPMVLIVCEDITESKQARQDLRESEARYRNIFQTVGVSILEEDFSHLKVAIDRLKQAGVQDFRGYLAAHPQFLREAVSMVRIVDVNDATFKLFEAEDKEELVTSLDRIFLPETLEVFAEEIIAIAEGGTSFEAETVLQTLKGARLTVLFTITFPPPDPGARFDSVLVTVTDITARKRAETEKARLEAELRRSQKMEAIGTLAGGIAHDFNNILGAILGYAELAQKKAGEGSALRNYLDQVMQAGGRGKRLVEHILAFSRSGLGERVPVHVQSVVEETLELLAASLPAGLRLEKRLQASDAAVIGDATQLHQVAMNLCTNAVQAIEHGGVVTVALDRVNLPEHRPLSHGMLSPSSYVRLEVSDTGRGIPPAVLERIFDPFFTTKGVGEGTGLGLSLVHGIVADFGGALDVTTQEGVGTTFAVWLPASGETAAPAADAAGLLPHGNGEAVMVVDDERALVALAEETLAELGYEPAGFDSSVAALAAFRAEPQRFDLVLTDETMPELTGTELAREIRRLRPDVPIVLMSGYSAPQLTERAQAAGVCDILRKPLVSRDIAESLARAFSQ